MQDVIEPTLPATAQRPPVKSRRSIYDPTQEWADLPGPP